MTTALFLYPQTGQGTFSTRKNRRSGRLTMRHCSLSASLNDNRKHWPAWGSCPLPSSLSSLLTAPALAQESRLAGKLWQVGGKRKAVRQKQLPARVEKSRAPVGMGRRRGAGSGSPSCTICGCQASFPSPSHPALLFKALIVGLNSGLKQTSELT